MNSWGVQHVGYLCAELTPLYLPQRESEIGRVTRTLVFCLGREFTKASLHTPHLHAHNSQNLARRTLVHVLVRALGGSGRGCLGLSRSVVSLGAGRVVPFLLRRIAPIQYSTQTV